MCNNEKQSRFRLFTNSSSFHSRRFYNPVPSCKKSELCCDLKEHFDNIFSNIKNFREKVASLSLNIMAET